MADICRNWRLKVNYKKNNKNYINIKDKNFPIYSYDLTIKYNKINNNIGSFVSFRLFNISSELYINIVIDNIKYSIIITKHAIYLKYSKKTKLYINTIFDKKFQDIFEYMNYITINIKLENSNLNLTINNLTIINYTFKYIVNKINNVKIESLSNNNKLIDLFNLKSIKRNLEKYNNIVKCICFGNKYLIKYYK